MDDILTVFNNVLVDSCRRNVSDIYLCVGTPWKYRLNGHISSINKLPILKPADTEAIVRHIITLSRNVLVEKMDYFIHLLKDFDCSYSVPGVLPLLRGLITRCT